MSLWDAHSEEFVRQAQLYNKFDPFCDCIICAEDATSGELATLLILVGDAARLPSPPPTLALTSSHSPVLPPHPLPPAGCAGLGEDALVAAAPERAAAAEAASGSGSGELCLNGLAGLNVRGCGRVGIGVHACPLLPPHSHAHHRTPPLPPPPAPPVAAQAGGRMRWLRRRQSGLRQRRRPAAAPIVAALRVRCVCKAGLNVPRCWVCFH